MTNSTAPAPNSKTWTRLILTIGLMALILLAIVIFKGKHFLALSFLALFVSLFPFYWRFEHRKMAAREVIFIAVMAAIAAVSRVPFAPLPNIQPTSFVIIVTALVLGPESGFIMGTTAAIVSNMFLGQGPWTPWQMFAWGVMGLTAGLLGRTKWIKHWGILYGFGFVWGFLFGWIMDLWYVLGFINPLTVKTFIAAYLASFYFDLAHGLCNVFFLVIFGKSWLRILERFKVKYGLLKN